MTNEVSSIFFGIAIILVLIFMPRGLIGWMNQWFSYAGKAYARFKGEVK
jgi:ABC-type branched-subunit amino acid transport system permease subunit